MVENLADSDLFAYFAVKDQYVFHNEEKSVYTFTAVYLPAIFW